MRINEGIEEKKEKWRERTRKERQTPKTEKVRVCVCREQIQADGEPKKKNAPSSRRPHNAQGEQTTTWSRTANKESTGKGLCSAALLLLASLLCSLFLIVTDSSPLPSAHALSCHLASIHINKSLFVTLPSPTGVLTSQIRALLLSPP